MQSITGPMPNTHKLIPISRYRNRSMLGILILIPWGRFYEIGAYLSQYSLQR